MSQARYSIERLPLRVVAANLAVTLGAIAALALVYARTGDREVLLAILIIGALTPVDTVLLYSVLKHHSARMLDILGRIEAQAPTAVAAPLGIKLVATWHTGDTIKTLLVSGGVVKLVEARGYRILSESGPGILQLLRLPVAPKAGGGCRWSTWSGHSRIKTLSPRGGVLELEGQVRVVEKRCKNTDISLEEEVEKVLPLA